jgi:two-component system, cell cycle response regulator DivK
MDLKLPGMDGFEVTRLIREHNLTIPIIAQTAYALTGDASKAIDSGCNDYIAKPIRKQELLRKIETLMS